MTTNAGSTYSSGRAGFGASENVSAEEARTMKALEGFLRPEFINRVDEIITFNSLTKENFERIAAIMLDELKTALAEKGMDLTYSDEALRYVGEKSYSAKYGARNLRRVIEREVEDKVASLIIDNFSKSIETVYVFAENEDIFGKIKYKRKNFYNTRII